MQYSEWRSNTRISTPTRIIYATLCLLGGLAVNADDSPASRDYAVILYPVPMTVALPESLHQRYQSRAWRDFPYPGLTSLGEISLIDESRLEVAFLQGAKPPAVDVREDIVALVRVLDDGGLWLIDSVAVYPFAGGPYPNDDRGAIAAETLKDEYLGGVIFLEFQFVYMPELDQLRIVIEVYVAGRSGQRRSRFTRQSIRYEYLTTPISKVLRAWGPGEKEALIDAVNRIYDSKVARWPHNERAYAKDQKTALRILKKQKTIFPAAAINERWSTMRLESDIRSALQDLRSVLAEDFHHLMFDRPKRKNFKRFQYIERSGRHIRLEGKVVMESNDRVVYRTKKGTVYSLPKQ